VQEISRVISQLSWRPGAAVVVLAGFSLIRVKAGRVRVDLVPHLPEIVTGDSTRVSDGADCWDSVSAGRFHVNLKAQCAYECYINSPI
jgi:hypothetical protein